MVNLYFLAYSMGALCGAIFFSSVYASLTVTGDAGLPRLIERGERHAKLLHHWQAHWGLLCKTARLFLTLCAIASIVLFYRAFHELDVWILLGSFVLLTFAYMVLVRIIPHVLAESYADRISLSILPVMRLLTVLVWGVVRPLQFIEDHLLRHAMSAFDEEDRPSSEDEIKTLIEEGDGQELEEEEREIIRSVFEFGDTITREIMTPRIDINGLKDTLSVDECIQLVNQGRHSRFPVYHESIDDVIGFVHVKDLLKLAMGGQSRVPISQLVKKIDFVPEAMPINDLMQLMKNNHAQMVLVVDEYGGTEGLVTMEDIIEELVGEIEDEYDENENEILKRADGSMVVHARISIDELNEKIGTKIPESDEYDSLGGYIFSALGHIPAVGEIVQVEGFGVKIQSATNRQIQLVHLVPELND